METSDREVADALLDVGRALMGVTLRSVAAAPVPLTVPQHRVLLLVATDGPRRVGALAADLGVNQSSASRLVDRLVAQGLVERLPDPADGRASLVALSPRGEAVLGAVHERRLTAVLDVVAAMPTRARPEVLALLAEVASAMEVEEDVCMP
jgi:DNA-binding MarR family transcriptional regulator